MDWKAIGSRIRAQREFMGYTREQFAEQLDVTPKFCSDIELGVKGVSVPTLCNIARLLRLSTDYILFGVSEGGDTDSLTRLLKNCSKDEQKYAEQLLKIFLMATGAKKDPH